MSDVADGRCNCAEEIARRNVYVHSRNQVRNLIARRVGTVRRMLVASPAYIERCGVPARPASLREHSVIAFTGLMPNREWRYQNAGKTAGVRYHSWYEINDALAAVDAAEAGHRITMALSYMVSRHLAAGMLLPVLEDFWLPPQPVNLAFSHTPLRASRGRAFVDFAAPG